MSAHFGHADMAPGAAGWASVFYHDAGDGKPPVIQVYRHTEERAARNHVATVLRALKRDPLDPKETFIARARPMFVDDMFGALQEVEGTRRAVPYPYEPRAGDVVLCTAPGSSYLYVAHFKQYGDSPPTWLVAGSDLDYDNGDIVPEVVRVLHRESW